jgi:hypothetical protein
MRDVAPQVATVYMGHIFDLELKLPFPTDVTVKVRRMTKAMTHRGMNSK